MAAKKSDKHVHDKDPEKTVDAPPYGSRNADPLSDQPGSHPVETGVGAVLGGVASGLAVGAVGGPVGAVIGGIVGGAAAGGLAGKGVGELIDPTTEDNWLREYHTSTERDTSRTSAKSSKSTTTTVRDVEDYRPAYRYGMSAASTYDRSFDEVEPELRKKYESDKTYSGMKWDEARTAVRDAYDRTIRLREERLKVDKTSEQVGEVGIRKEVRTEHQTVTVPVQKEEVVIERRAVNKTTPGGMTADRAEAEIRIPVREEKVKVSKETVTTEEVSLGKRKVEGSETVEADVKKEYLKTDETGSAKIKGDKGESKKK